MIDKGIVMINKIKRFIFNLLMIFTRKKTDKEIIDEINNYLNRQDKC